MVLKTIICLLLLFHGLIHLMGFAKAFEFAELEQLKQPISKVQGLLWLTVTILFLTTLAVYLFRKDWWWMIALVAVLISQIVIFFSWQDAKFGTIANLMMLGVIKWLVGNTR